MELKIETSNGRDLYVEYYCTCPSSNFKGTNIEHLMKKRVILYGYNDDYFFNEVNKEPRAYACSCGKKYTQQWFRSGKAIVEEVN